MSKTTKNADRLEKSNINMVELDKRSFTTLIKLADIIKAKKPELNPVNRTEFDTLKLVESIADYGLKNELVLSVKAKSLQDAKNLKISAKNSRLLQGYIRTAAIEKISVESPKVFEKFFADGIKTRIYFDLSKQEESFLCNDFDRIGRKESDLIRAFIGDMVDGMKWEQGAIKYESELFQFKTAKQDRVDKWLSMDAVDRKKDKILYHKGNIAATILPHLCLPPIFLEYLDKGTLNKAQIKTVSTLNKDNPQRRKTLLPAAQEALDKLLEGKVVDDGKPKVRKLSEIKTMIENCSSNSAKAILRWVIGENIKVSKHDELIYNYENK